MFDLKGRKLVLASESPRRAQLFRLIGLDFVVRKSGVDEDNDVPQDPGQHVLTLSRRKAEHVAAAERKALVVGADTIVVIDGEILGKPSSPQQAYDMLRRLSGRTHRVFTGFTVVETQTGASVADVEVTEVHFRELEDDEIWRYIETGSPMDKAGAYGIQDQSAVFVDRISGCFYNVVGFPLARFYVRMREFLAQL
ncbi:MAG TPA: septum formation inhibitor Maf [Bacteroidetes bacterium]|nr:septum formation inhibitor Maf [Bacteroidota bacterium]